MKTRVLVLCLIGGTILAQTPRLVWEIPSHAGYSEITVSQDGKRCGTENNHDWTAKLWSIADRKLLATTCYIDPLFSSSWTGDMLGISLSPRGEHIAVHGRNGGDSMAAAPGAEKVDPWVFSAQGGRTERALTWDLMRVVESNLQVNDTSWHAEQTDVRVLDAHTGDLLAVNTMTGRALRSPITSSDHKHVAYIDTLNREIVVLEIASASLAGTFKVGTEKILQIAFSLDGKILTGFDTSGVIRQWDVQSKVALSFIQVPIASVLSNDGAYYCTLEGKDSIVVYRCDNAAFVGSVVDRLHSMHVNVWVWERFSARLASDGENIFVLYHAFDSSWYDYSWTSEEVYVGIPNMEDRPQPLYRRGAGPHCYIKGGESFCTVIGPNLIEERSSLGGTLWRTLTIDVPKGYFVYGLWSTRDMKSFYLGIAHYQKGRGKEHTLEKYDGETFTRLFSRTYDSTFGEVYEIIEAPDGSIAYILRSMQPQSLKMSVTTGDTMHWLNDTLQSFNSFDLSPDGTEMVLASWQKPAKRVNTETGQVIKDLTYYFPHVARYDPTGSVLLLTWPENRPAEATCYTEFLLYDIATDKLIGSQGDRHVLYPYLVENYYWLSDSVFIASVPSRNGGWSDESGGLIIYNPYSKEEAHFTFMHSAPINWYWLYGYHDDRLIRINGSVYFRTQSQDGTMSMWEIQGSSSSVAKKGQELLMVYPNPAFSEVRIRFPAPLQGAETYTVVDVHGRSVLAKCTIDREEEEVVISTASLAPGMYFLVSQTLTHLRAKFIKE